jgi:hypothetical protein
MTNRLAGYTVIEVMLFLTISTVIFIAAVAIFSGRSEQTRFTQTMQDIQSQFRAYGNQVSTSYTPDTAGKNCKVGPVAGISARPLFTSSPVVNQECVLLGRAVQVIEGQDTIFAYPVFGLKTIHNGAVDTKAFPASAAEAGPAPAVDDASPQNWLGVEEYHIPNGLTVNKASLTTAAGSPQDLLLLYSSLQNSNTTGTEIDAFSQGIKFSQLPDAKNGALKNCIENISCSSNSLNGSTWKLCLSDGTKMAELLVKSVTTGITTSLNMNGCT